MSVCRTVYEIFSVKEWRNLETEGRGSFLINSTLNNIVTLKSGLEVTQDHWNWYHSKAWMVSYSPSTVTMALSCISSKIKPDIGRKSWFFHTPLAFDAPVRGVPSVYWHPVWYGKTRMLGLPDGEKNFEDMYNRLLNTGVWQTDRQTSCHSIVRAMHTHCQTWQLANAAWYT